MFFKKLFLCGTMFYFFGGSFARAEDELVEPMAAEEGVLPKTANEEGPAKAGGLAAEAGAPKSGPKDQASRANPSKTPENSTATAAPAGPDPDTGEAAVPPVKRKKGADFIEMVLDASGSMLGEIKGELKIQTAKRMITAFIKGVEIENSSVAVRTFGNRDGSCKDIQLKLDFYKKDQNSLKSIIGEISPKNKARTPLAVAMDQSFKHLKKQPGSKNLIVFTDGKETCGGNPCEVARKVLKEMDVRIFLVAYGVKNAKEFKELQCITDEAGPKGKAMNPAGTFELAAAMAKIRQEIKQSEQGLIIQGPDPTVWATALRTDGPKGEIHFVSGVGTDLPAGTYKVTAEYPVPYVFPNVVIKKQEVKVLKVGGSGKIRPEFINPMMKLEAINLETSEKIPLTVEGETVTAPIGKYTIYAKTSTGLAYQWPTTTVLPSGTSKLSPPPWGILKYRSQKEQPYRVYRKDGKGAGMPDLSLDPKDPTQVPIKKLIKDRDPEAVALSNKEVLLEEGNYLLVFANGSFQDDVKIKRGKETDLP